jgi:ribosomal-protein-alanine N-acetyltransferase
MMEIRVMKASDIDAVVAIENQNFRDPWTAQIFEEEMAQASRTYYVAELEGKVIGYMGMIWILDEGHITNIAVDPAYHGHGYGRTLINHVARIAFDKGMESLTLEVRASNKRAIHVYEKMGFINEGTRPKYYEGKEDAYIMWLYRGDWNASNA